MTDIVAYELGYLEEAGFTEFSNLIINESLTAIIGAGVDWSAADTTAVIPAIVDHGVEAVYLGTRRGRENLLFGLAPGVTLDSLVAENGFVSGGEIGARNELMSKKMLSELGVDPENDVQWVAMGGGSDTRLVALLNGQLMGSNIQLRHVAQLEAAGGTVVYNENRDIPQDGYTVMREFLDDHRDAVVAFFYALIRAKQYIKDLSTKDDVIAMVEAHDFELPEEFVNEYEASVDTISADGGFEIEEMELVWEEAGILGEAGADIDWRSAVDLGPLWEAQEAAGLPRRPASL